MIRWAQPWWSMTLVARLVMSHNNCDITLHSLCDVIILWYRWMFSCGFCILPMPTLNKNIQQLGKKLRIFSSIGYWVDIMDVLRILRGCGSYPTGNSYHEIEPLSLLSKPLFLVSNLLFLSSEPLVLVSEPCFSYQNRWSSYQSLCSLYQSLWSSYKSFWSSYQSLSSSYQSLWSSY